MKPTIYINIPGDIRENIKSHGSDMHDKIGGNKASCIVRYTDKSATLAARSRGRLYCTMNTYVGEERLAVSQL